MGTRGSASNVASAILGLCALAAVVSLGWTYLRRAEPFVPKRAERRFAIPKELDTRELKILNFYIAETAVRGQPTLLCYNVINAASVSLEPKLAEVTPSLSRCVEVIIRKETELTLIATGYDGLQTRASFVVGVQEPRPEFAFVNISAREIRRGEKFTLCYTSKNATAIRLLPPGPPVSPGENVCVMWYPALSPIKLVAESKAGREEVTLPLKVR